MCCAYQHFQSRRSVLNYKVVSSFVFKDYRIMTVNNCNGVCNWIQYPPPSASAPPTLVSLQKMFARNSVSCKKLLFRRVTVTLEAYPLKSGCITEQESVFQSSTKELHRPVLDSDHPTYPLEKASASRRHHKNGDDHVVLADMWKEIQGSHQWDGLLDPLHPLLLAEIIRYGVFVRACYEALDWQLGSKFLGICKYGRKSFFRMLGMENCGYRVTKYIYATPDINVPDFLKKKLEAGDRSNWIGYVAVSDKETEIKRLGRRDIVVAMRGTGTFLEWLANFMHTLIPARLNPLDPREDVKVEMGFLGLYTSHDLTCMFNHGSAREQLLCEIARLLRKHKGEELSITITGHSMGSALAMLCAYDIAELELNRRHHESCSGIPIAVYSFAGPRVGNGAFKDRCNELGLKILRVVNVHDVVTKIPGVIFNENFRLWENVMDRIIPWAYSHVGVELAIDHKLQPQCLQGKTRSPSCIHDLATYLQVLACYNYHNDHLHRHKDDHQIHYNGNSNSGASLIRSFFDKHLLFVPLILLQLFGKVQLFGKENIKRIKKLWRE